MDEYIGIIKIFAGNFAPQGWAFCDGSLLAISQNAALFSILGTTYGGNGQTTFALPDLRGRFPIGMGTGPGLPTIVEGEMAGTANTTILVSNLPAHTHTATVTQSTATVSANSGDATISAPTAGSSLATPGSLSGRTFAGTLGYNTSAPNVALNSSSVSLTPATVTNAVTGSGVPISTQPPYLGVNYIISLVGVYPSRS